LQNNAHLRKEIRAQRRALSIKQQQQHMEAMTRQLCRSPLFQRSRRIALYLPADGEMDTGLILATTRARNKRCFLPVLRPGNCRRLWFAQYQAGDRLYSNRFGILEPNIHAQPPVTPWSLDLILMPLVAFDPKGNRLGMGGGFYDRTLSYLRTRRHWRSPKLIGIAHELQRTTAVNSMQWDIPLDGVVTEQNFYRWKR
jgi:5-formyltetrahydrofolate cyclo-ligase